MKTSTIWSKGLLLLTVSFLVLLTISGCKKDDNPVDATETIPNNLFPLVTGHTIIYGQGTLLNLNSTSPLPGTETGFTSSWTIVGQTNPAQFPFLPAPHTTSTLIVDVTSIPAAGVSNAQRPFFIYQDTTTGNFDFLTNLSFFFRSQLVYKTPGDSTSGIRTDTLVWIQLAKPSEGLNKEYVTYSANFTSAKLGPLKLEIVAKFKEKTTATFGGSSYTVYKLEATRKVYLGTSTVSASTAKTAEIWLAPGVGPVYIELIGDEESHGKSQTMTSKSF